MRHDEDSLDIVATIDRSQTHQRAQDCIATRRLSSDRRGADQIVWFSDLDQDRLCLRPLPQSVRVG
jgi:hypothetical protein